MTDIITLDEEITRKLSNEFWEQYGSGEFNHIDHSEKNLSNSWLRENIGLEFAFGSWCYYRIIDHARFVMALLRYS